MGDALRVALECCKRCVDGKILAKWLSPSGVQADDVATRLNQILVVLLGRKALQQLACRRAPLGNRVQHLAHQGSLSRPARDKSCIRRAALTQLEDHAERPNIEREGVGRACRIWIHIQIGADIGCRLRGRSGYATVGALHRRQLGSIHDITDCDGRVPASRGTIEAV
eukprot:scaffold61621_cov31-Tisochrysis_lutea.AAC.4